METDINAKSPPKLSLLDLLMLGGSGAILRLAMSAGMRAWAIHPRSAAAWGLTLASLALALSLVWQLLRIWRRRDSWALYLGPRCSSSCSTRPATTVPISHPSSCL